MPIAYFHHGPISFRLVETQDADLVRELRNDESTWVHLTDARPIFPGDQAAWLQTLGLRHGKLYFVAFDEKNPFVGIVRMDEHDALNRSIRVGADVVPGLRRKGYGKAIYEAVKKYCFDTLNCHRVWLQVLETNFIARQLYEHSGFSHEGILRDAVWRSGRYVNYHVMSILEAEYRKL